MRKVLVTPILAGLTGLAALAVPATAQAANPPTVVTLTIGGGALSITTPAAATLSGTAGTATASGTIGPVTVDDSLGAGWVTSAASTNFVEGTNVTNIIPASTVSYAPGTITPTGSVTLASDGTGPIGGTGRAVVTATATNGITSASWNPTISIPTTTAAAGTYTGTITQSVV